MKITNTSKGALLRQASSDLNGCLERYKDQNKLLLLSGGSALDILGEVKEGLVDNQTTISVLDERWSNDPRVNNFRQIQATAFCKEAQKKGAIFLETIPKNMSLEEMAGNFNEELKSWRRSNPEGKIIITQGMGEDGHTAGIFGYPDNPALFKKLFEEGESWVVGYDAGEKNQFPKRITTRLNFLREQVDFSLFYVSGESKREVLKRVLDDQGEIYELPARAIHQMKEVSVFTDISLDR